MILRTIMIFPQFEEIRIIEQIRKKYDPLAELIRLHNLLYRQELKVFDLGYDYEPHMTVGKLPSKQLLDEAFKEVCAMNKQFITTVNKVSVEMVGEHEESIIIIEKNLRA